MEIDGRHCETEESQRQKANRYSCRKLLERLKKYHSEENDDPASEEVSPLPEPIVTTKCDDDDLPPRSLMLSRIQHVVCRHFKVKRNDLCSARRFAHIVLPRQVGYYLATELTSLSMPKIGRRFGGRDHTTVLSGKRKIARMISSDPEFAQTIRELEERIR